MNIKVNTKVLTVIMMPCLCNIHCDFSKSLLMLHKQHVETIEYHDYKCGSSR